MDIISYTSTGPGSFAELTLTQSQNNVLVSSAAGTITITNVLLADITAADFAFAGSAAEAPAQDKVAEFLAQMPLRENIGMQADYAAFVDSYIELADFL